MSWKRAFQLCILSVVVLSLCLAALMVVSCGQSQEEKGPVEVSPSENYRPGQLIVKFKSDVSAGERESVIEESGGESVIQTVGPEENKTYLVQLKPDISVEKASEDFESHDEVEYAEPNYVRNIQE